jgi:hypothetical protein
MSVVEKLSLHRLNLSSFSTMQLDAVILAVIFKWQTF